MKRPSQQLKMLCSTTPKYLYSILLQYNGDWQDLMSLFPKTTYGACSFVDITPNMLLIVAILLDSFAGPTLLDKYLLPLEWKKYVNPIYSLP